MDAQTMTNEQNYRFDVAGYLIIPGVLATAELNACNQALDHLGPFDGPLRSGPTSNPLLGLREHPVLSAYLQEICGEGFRLDESPRLVGCSPGDTPLTGGGEWVDWSRAYRQYNGDRFCQGVRVFWALADVGEDAGGLVVVPASHNSTVEAPQALVGGAEALAALAPVLGDVLAGTRVASHATAEEKLPEAGSFEVRDAVFAPRP